jgi:hypothetical protein
VQTSTELKVKVTLRLAVYRQSVRLGAMPLELTKLSCLKHLGTDYVETPVSMIAVQLLHH